MKILGIDPGLATIGLGLVQANNPQDMQALEWHTITTPPQTPLPDRLREIAKDLREYLKETQPDLAVVEKLYFGMNAKTAIDVAQARGVLLETVARQAIPIMEPTPLQLKSCITGDGRADKKQIQDMLQMMFNLEEAPKPDDAADALALAVYGALQGKRATLIA